MGCNGVRIGVFAVYSDEIAFDPVCAPPPS
jgi:hypothetical protein